MEVFKRAFGHLDTLQCSQEALSLIKGLLIFHFRLEIVDDAAAMMKKS